MPKDNIQRAIDKAVGGGGENIEEVRYEGYGPGGVALIVEAQTDNRNRTGSDIRAAFSKYGGALGEPNSVTFMFSRVGVIGYPKDKGSDDAMLETRHRGGRRRSESPAMRRMSSSPAWTISARFATRWKQSSDQPRQRRSNGGRNRPIRSATTPAKHW